MDLAERLRSALGDRYRIEEEIGSGGMATVFKAQDLKHGRAISELQEGLTSGFVFGTWITWYPWLRPLHDDPRYQRLVAPK